MTPDTVPRRYEFCEREHLGYLFGISTNAVFEERSDDRDTIGRAGAVVERLAGVRERGVRHICAVLDWRKQRKMWEDLVGSRSSGTADPIRISAR